MDVEWMFFVGMCSGSVASAAAPAASSRRLSSDLVLEQEKTGLHLYASSLAVFAPSPRWPKKRTGLGATRPPVSRPVCFLSALGRSAAF